MVELLTNARILGARLQLATTPPSFAIRASSKTFYIECALRSSGFDACFISIVSISF